MNLFKPLTAEEEKEYRKWARDNYVPFEPIKGVWHPIVQDECVKMNAEKGSNNPLESNLCSRCKGEDNAPSYCTCGHGFSSLESEW